MKRFLGVLFALVLVFSLAAIGFPSPVLAQPSAVWVDDDFTPATPGWGTTRFDNIQDGIDAVASPGTVHVAAGYYAENIFLKYGVQVLGAGATGTTIDGSTARGGLPAYHVVVGANNATLNGFTVTGGNANGTWNNGKGGGMYNDNCSSLMVANCTFYNNSAWDDGGGMYNHNSSPTVTNCTFSSNSAGWGGGMYNGESSPTVTNCTFLSNSAVNGAGGMYNHHYSSVTVTNCTFSNNSATWGGGMQNHYHSSVTVTNCIFSGNSATWGGGINNDESSTTVTNCTFYGNSATAGGRAISGSTFTVTNCILWDNGNEIANGVVVTYSDIQGGYSGVGNIDANPLFVNPAAGNYHLQTSSPCIDAGTNVGAPNKDIEGNPRPIDGDGDGTAITDMGAYEEYAPPQLSSPSVQPTSGTPSTNFYYYVSYYDSAGHSPYVRRVYIDGTFYTMSLHSGIASNGTYRYGPKNLSVGSHDYYFYFEDSKGGTARLPTSGSYSGPGVSEANNPPNVVSNPSPVNHAAGVPIDADLNWTGGDPDAGDTVTYYVYFGTSVPPPLISYDQSATTYDPGTLNNNTTYYWKIVARDNHWATTQGPTWDFTTVDAGALPGDANGDGVVNIFDITYLEMIVAGLEAETPGADANEDGEVNIFDITYLEMIVAGLV